MRPSRTHRASRTAVVGFALAICGCGSSATAPTSKYHGVLWLSWTIAGQSASEAACAEIDHLVITVESTPTVGVEIAPVGCSLGVSWERNDVPEGSDAVVVDALDSTGRAAFESVAMVGVTDARPPTPTTVDLQPL